MEFIEYNDVQGLVRFAHGKLASACFLLLRIRDGHLARSWCQTAPITSAESLQPPPEEALQIAFTASGLRAMGLPASVVAQFAPEFLAGMAQDPSRSRRLGDQCANAPQRWRWGAGSQVPDLVLMLYAKRDVSAFSARLQTPTWHAAFDLIECLNSEDIGGFEPFGFLDGISQPEIDWTRAIDPDAAGHDYSNRVALGELLLGYPNEYGFYADRPLIDPHDDPLDTLPVAENDATRRDFARNGTFLVMRQLDQNVRAFWTYLDGLAESDAQTREMLAAKMVGRKRNGEPLVSSKTLNDFSFR